jgi:hypothetical protein
MNYLLYLIGYYKYPIESDNSNTHIILVEPELYVCTQNNSEENELIKNYKLVIDELKIVLSKRKLNE